jgi:hypothetical protein
MDNQHIGAIFDKIARLLIKHAKKPPVSAQQLNDDLRQRFKFFDKVLLDEKFNGAENGHLKADVALFTDVSKKRVVDVRISVKPNADGGAEVVGSVESGSTFVTYLSVYNPKTLEQD